MRFTALALIVCSILASGCARRDTDWSALAGAVGKTVNPPPASRSGEPGKPGTPDPESRPFRRP
jgi:hypothetical protein